MFARGVFSIYPPRLLASSCFPSKPFVSPTYKITVRNSFVSPTYAKTGGCTPPKMSARRHLLSLFSQSSLSGLFPFNPLRTLSFSVAHLSPVSTVLSALFHQKPGVYPLWSDQSHFSTVPSDHSSSLSAVDCQLPSPPFTSHSQSCYRPFTHPSPCLVTMFPSQGSDSHTMPITIRTPTVHFYQCDPPREIRS
jgi:hypothetical protein